MNQQENNSGQNIDQSKPELQRKLGLLPVIALGVGSTVGAGIFTTLSDVSLQAGSSLFLVLAFAIGSILQIPSALCYAELSSAYPEDGGQYIYFREAGSKSLAFLSGWISLLATDPPSVAIMSLALVNYMGVFIPLNEGFLRLIAIGIVLIFMSLHIRTVKGGGRFQVFITILKIIPFILIICVGFFYIKPYLFMSATTIPNHYSAGYSPIQMIGPLFAAISIASFSFDGLYSACYVSGEIKNPKKNLPIGLIVTAIVVMVLYVSLTVVASGLLTSEELSTSHAPIALLASKIPYIGEAASIVVSIIACIVILGTISSCIMYQPRIEYAMAKDGYFFKIFDKVHKKYKTPYVAILFHSAIIILLIFVGDLSDILNYFTLVVLLKNFSAYATMFVLRKKKNYNPSYRCPGGYLMPIICMSFTGLCMISTVLNVAWPGVLCAIIVILSGLPAFYFWNRKQKQKAK